MSDGGQQQQQQQDTPKFDMADVIGSLAEPHRVMAEKKGWVREGKPVEGFKLDTVFDSYAALEKLQGGKTLAVPDLSNPDAFAKWEGHALLQVPDKVEGYEFEKPALPDGLKWSEAEGDGGIQWDAAGEKMLRAALLKGKVGKVQAKAIMAEIAQERIGAIVASRAEHNNQSTMVKGNLEKDFGAGLKGALATGSQAIAFIAEKAKVDPKAVVSAIEQMAGPEAALRFSIQLGKMLGEDTLAGGKGSGFTTGPDAAKAEIAAMESDPEQVKALTERDHVGHKAATEKRNRLYKIAHPES